MPTSSPVKDRKTFLFGSVLAALALLLGTLALALPGANPLRGEELLSIECADIVFGTGKYTDSAFPKLESLEHSGIALSGIESSFCYYKAGEGGLRLGSKNNPGSITFFFDGAYRVKRLLCRLYRRKRDSRLPDRRLVERPFDRRERRPQLPLLFGSRRGWAFRPFPDQ